MPPSRLRAFRAEGPSLSEEPRYFTRIPDDATEDPRLKPTTILVFLALLREHWTAERVIHITAAEIARRCRKSTKTVYREMARLEHCQYLRWHRDQSRKGKPWIVTLCYELRPSLELDANTRATARKVSPMSTRARSPMSTRARSPMSTTPLFEGERERETTTREGSSLLSSPSTGEESPELGPLIREAMAAWPGTPAIEVEVARLARRGVEWAALLLEYARLMGADSIAYAAKVSDRWYADGLDLADVRDMVRARRPRPKPAAEAPEARGATEKPRTDPEAKALMDAFRRARGRAERARILAELERGAAAEKNPAAGKPAKTPPAAGPGRCSVSTDLPAPNCSVSISSRQETPSTRNDRHFARPDSNRLPADAGPDPRVRTTTED